MRSLLFLAVLVPFFTQAQINRSAREFAGEKIGEYVSTRLFRDLPYKPLSFGELKSDSESDRKDIFWSLAHRFEITDTLFVDGRMQAVTKPYTFVFYLDRRMNVKRAETYDSN